MQRHSKSAPFQATRQGASFVLGELHSMPHMHCAWLRTKIKYSLYTSTIPTELVTASKPLEQINQFEVQSRLSSGPYFSFFSYFSLLFLFAPTFPYFFMKMRYYPFFFTQKCHLRIKIQKFFLARFAHLDFI